MFDKVGGMMSQMMLLQRLGKDKNFRAFILHPKVQELFKDSEFQKVIASQDSEKIINHPKLIALQKDPELAALIGRMNFQELFEGQNG